VAEDVRGIGEAMEHEKAMAQMRYHPARAGREIQAAQRFLDVPEQGRTRTARIRPPVVGHDGELIGENLCYPPKVATIPRSTRYEEHRRAASTHLMVDPCAVGLEERTT
jgi:hypothetical protein